MPTWNELSSDQKAVIMDATAAWDQENAGQMAVEIYAAIRAALRK